MTLKRVEGEILAGCDNYMEGPIYLWLDGMLCDPDKG